MELIRNMTAEQEKKSGEKREQTHRANELERFFAALAASLCPLQFKLKKQKTSLA